MMSLWIAMAVLSLLTISFVVWPLWRQHAYPNPSTEDAKARLAANIALFHEHIAELDVALAEGRIDSAQHQQLKLEQQRALLNDETAVNLPGATSSSRNKGLVLAALCVVGLAIGLYQNLGSSQDVQIRQMQIEKAQLDYQDLLSNREPDPERTRDLMAEIEARLAQQSENLQYWVILARQAMSLGDYATAVTAYREILSRDPQATIIMAELAQAIFLRDNNQITPEVSQLAHKALASDPTNTTALGLAGIDAFQKEDFREAINYWQQAITVLGADAPGSHALQSGIDRARKELADRGEELPASSEPVAAAGAQIHLKLSLAASVDATPDQRVYVYARAWQGGRMPLAITRLTVADLPATVTLDESMAMSATASLATADQVEVVARISADGSATAKPGDWQASAGPFNMKSLPAQIELVVSKKLEE